MTPGAGASRCRGGYEHRHASSEGSGNNGGPRSNPTKLIEIVEIGKQLLITKER